MSGLEMLYEVPNTGMQTEQLPKNNPYSSVTSPPWARTWCTAFLASSIVYLATGASGILWGDSGETQLRVLTCQLQDTRELARSHVTYFAVACGITKCLGADAIIVANAVSAIAGAATVANVTMLLACLVRRRLSVICGTCLLLFSHTLWQMSAGAEVVTFSTMLLSLELLCVVRFIQTDRFAWLAMSALLNGLGWSTHNFALLIWPAYVTLLAINPTCFRTLGWRRGLVLGLLWLAGTAPLGCSLIQELNTQSGTEEAFRSVFVGAYGSNVFNLHVTAGLGFRVLAYICLNFPTPLLILAPFGVFHFCNGQPKSLAWFMTAAAVLFFVFAARYNVPDQYTFLTHSHIFVAIFITVGLDRILTENSGKLIDLLAILLCCLAPGFYAILPKVAENHLTTWVKLPQRILPYRPPYHWFLQPWRCVNDGARRYATEVLDALPLDAVLLADSTAAPPIDLVQGSLRKRLDVRIPGTLLVRPWQDPIALDQALADKLIEDSLLYCTSKNTLRHWGDWFKGDGYTFEPEGHVYKVVHSTPAKKAQNMQD